MDTVCHGKQWDVALVHDPDGRIAAAMPYPVMNAILPEVE